jgi:hypothetical protein
MQRVCGVGAMAVDPPTPEEGKNDEHAAVRGVDASEMCGLQCRDDAVEKE